MQILIRLKLTISRISNNCQRFLLMQIELDHFFLSDNGLLEIDIDSYQESISKFILPIE
ncbi:hypothetical protein GmarT_24610 [Gimesia maris]|jgi:hypothetical protein|uniref:Uncharacterized protein n=1 Tax=Gimesia maris TaxID=122 RepID=A0ABX5YLU4_9PLAN|nr:hypothetical protein GmarT_24610 [Gimesia maris]